MIGPGPLRSSMSSGKGGGGGGYPGRGDSRSPEQRERVLANPSWAAGAWLSLGAPDPFSPPPLNHGGRWGRENQASLSWERFGGVHPTSGSVVPCGVSRKTPLEGRNPVPRSPLLSFTCSSPLAWGRNGLWSVVPLPSTHTHRPS